MIHRKKNDWVADNLVTLISPVLDDTDAKPSSSKPSLSTSSNGDKKDSISDVTCPRSDSSNGQVVVTKSILSDEGKAHVSTVWRGERGRVKSCGERERGRDERAMDLF